MERTGRRLVDFYAGSAPDDRGRYVYDIQGWSDERLESVHDYIQWLFPLRERSAFNPQAPVLDDAAIAEFRARPELRQNLRTSFLRILRFYGFEEKREGIEQGSDFATRSSNWLSPSNHNHLRITRILTSIRLLGLEAEAQAFYTCLARVYRRQKGSITPETFAYWTAAGGETLPGSAASGKQD